ncbi:MAG: CehA/McbA family metallohydrolase [Longimicrobiales bacterium]|nr:CehA/McbA family metallohydrolase [Longimicrobiales bacterium]
MSNPPKTGRTSGRALPLACGFLAVVAVALSAGPNRYGHSDRVERHMLPAVSTGPMDPAWSPDGRWIAFSMRGDIWKVPAEGGEAIALTEGPAWHFEPSWSPDGSRLALSIDLDGNLEIGVVSAEGGAVRRITDHPEVDVQPTWSADGAALYFTSARASRRFGIFRVALDDGSVTGVTGVTGGIQAAVSPDGTRLAYVAPVRGRTGTGGIWVKALPDGEERLVRHEESEYRMKPAWSVDGSGLFYISDESGSNEVRRVAVDGGDPVVITPDPGGEFSPSPSPDGERIAFVSNRRGAMTLYTAPIGGGPLPSWTEIPLDARRARLPTGRLTIEVVGPDGAPMPSRIHLEASDGRAYTPEGGFHRVISVTETHYFHTQGSATVEVPAGRTEVEAVRGHEYRPAVATVEVPAGGEATLRLEMERMVDLPTLGWYSGDTHLHDLHQGRRGLTHEEFFGQLLAEDLHMSHALIHMDGTRLMGRWDDLTGAPHPLSTAEHILRYGEEFRGSLGHVSLLGTERFVLPLIGGAANTPYAQPELDGRHLRAARARGGLGGFTHPYLGDVSTPRGVGSTLIPVDAALGLGDHYDVASVYSDEMRSSEVYHRLLNAGVRIAATGGSDNFSDVWRDPPPGAARTYARVEGPLTAESWMEGIRRQRTFASTGPLLFLEVEGRGPGDELELPEGGSLTVTARASSIAPMARLEIVANGEIAAARSASGADSSSLVFEGDVTLPEGGWVAARVVGPSSRYITDSYAFAHTSPVYIVRDGLPHRSAEDARFLAEAVDAAWARVEGGPWRSDAERARFRAEIERARGVYERIALDSLFLHPEHPEWSRRSPSVWRARFETTEGDFEVEVTREHAPIGADRFYNLVRLGYYDDTRFHRVNEGYIAQLGIHGDPAVNAAWEEAFIADDPPHGTNTRGTFAFAHAPIPGNRTTQIFFNLGDNSRNDRDGFAVFGRVVEGIEVLDRLYAGYGERSGSGVRQGRQGPLREGGNAFMDREFPALDRVIRARVIE